MRRGLRPTGLAIAAFCAAANAQAPAWVTEGPRIDGDAVAVELPVEAIASKLYVQVGVGGKARRFVVDTGSPSMISAELATELGLKSIDTIRGTDAHGVTIESPVVQLDMDLAGTRVSKVPVVVADFSRTPAAACLVGDGVLGAELLPLCAWQFDLPDRALRCHTDPGSLQHVDGATRQSLYDFGYPHIPYVDIRLAQNAVSKAMFDTGSPHAVAISPPDLGGAERNGAVTGTTTGYGSPGTSLGGPAPMQDLRRVDLGAFSVGETALGPVRAVVREAPPTLIGAPLLAHYVVTLDVRSETAYLDRHTTGEPLTRNEFGFALAFDDGVTVSQVWSGTPAFDAGLRAGTTVTTINGEAAATSCDGIRRALDAMAADEIQIAWDGGTAVFTR